MEEERKAYKALVQELSSLTRTEKGGVVPLVPPVVKPSQHAIGGPRGETAPKLPSSPLQSN